MKILSSKSIRTHLTYWFLVLSLIPLIAALVITYFQRANATENMEFNKLITIRDLKVQQLTKWVDEVIGDLNVMAGDYEIRALEGGLLGKELKSTQDVAHINTARELFLRNLRNDGAYSEIFLMNAETGTIAISTNPQFIGINKSHESYVSVPTNTGKVYIQDVYYSSETGKNEMIFSTPVYCMKHNTHLIGILAIRINLDNSLYKLLNNRTGLGETGETLIVNKDLMAINELRWFANAPLHLKINAMPAKHAAQGETGIIADIDYHGTKVLAAYTYIPQTGWGFVAKQNMSEIQAPNRKMLRDFSILLLISVILIVFVALRISKSISKPIVRMNGLAKKMKEGDFSVRNAIQSEDELGSLAMEFNNMAAMIESKMIVQQGISDISTTMIDKSTMKEFGSSLLKRLMKITEANMSTFYILNESDLVYEHFASVGVNEQLLTSFNALNPQGEFGNALSTKKIFYLREIPEDTIFKFKTVAGEAIPKEIITIPVVVENNIIAIISLVNIKHFSKECIEIIEQSWSSINTSYSNLIASERTRIFAEQLTLTNQQLESQSEELQEQSEELQNQTDELHRTTEELQEQNIELEAQRKQVETANKMKSEFLSNMSHELRTPLNSIMALSRVLITQANHKLDKEENSYLEIVERNGKKLLSLINDILDLSKIEAGKMEIIPEFISLKPVVSIVKENLQSLSDEKGIRLSVSFPDDLPQVETEENKLHQILTNIVGNAVKFTENGGVDIMVTHDSEKVFIEIQDTGIGISSADLPHIFDEFRQADGSSSRPYEGTGLGLAIANKMTNILGGKITVKSQLGEGTSFTVSLPIKWHDDRSFVQKYSFEDKVSPSMAKTILVVDDDPKAVKGISEYLNEAGYKTIGANSGKEAVQFAENFLPFAITMDIIMPEMDGWEAIQKLKKNERTKDIPVIIISASDDKETGSALGAIGYVNKPVNKRSLIKEVNKINKASEIIMIVDDNEWEGKQMSKMIENEKINTIIATSGSQCMKLLEDKIPDILVLDLMMPEMDGFEVLHKIREKAETRELPVIIVSAKNLTAHDKSKLSGKVSSIIAKSDTTAVDLYKEIKRILIEWEKIQNDAVTLIKKSQQRLLLVEDNLEAIVQVKSVLENEKFIIDIAEGGQMALDFVEHTIPDGIILDLMMPDVDGFEVLEKLRSTEKTKNIPVLILTAKDLTRDDLSKLSANNIQQLIYKGDIDIKGLLHKVKLMLGDRASKNSISIQNPNFEMQQSKLSNIKLGKNEQQVSKIALSNVLVVEDNMDNMLTIKAILGNKYAVKEAFDGDEGLKCAQSDLPDVILLDMSLPKMSGEEMIKILKENEKTAHIPVIAVTAQAMKGDKERFIEMGCDGYVSKPIDQELLLKEIDRLLTT